MAAVPLPLHVWMWPVPTEVTGVLQGESIPLIFSVQVVEGQKADPGALLMMYKRENTCYFWSILSFQTAKCSEPKPLAQDSLWPPFLCLRLTAWWLGLGCFSVWTVSLDFHLGLNL